MTVSYKISFPDVEVDAIHGGAAIDKATELLKSPEYRNIIKWEETHTEDCNCYKCEEKL